MGRYFKYGIALIRGVVFFIFTLFCSSIHCGKSIIIYSGTVIRARKSGKVLLGNKIRIGSNTCISALNGGQIIIGDNVSIGSKCNLIAHDSIYVGNNTIFAQNIQIYDHDHKFDAASGVKRKEFKTAPIHIGKNCWLGVNTVILRGTEIGDNCVIGAGCILKGKYPDGSLIIQPRETVVRPLK